MSNCGGVQQCGIPMGFLNQVEWGDFSNVTFKHKNRWKLIIPGVSGGDPDGDGEIGADSLPPLRGGKPSFSFKEMQGEHLNETIYFPSKPDWKPLALTLFDISKGKQNPVFNWLQKAYDPANCSFWGPSCGGTGDGYRTIKAAEIYLNMYDGCGNVLEQWVFEHAWPQTLEFSDGDMASVELVVCDVTLRYDRAYIRSPNQPSSLEYEMELPSYTCSAQITPSPAMSMVQFQSLPKPEFVFRR